MKLFTQVCVIHLNALCVGLIVSENCHVSLPPQDFTSQIAADVNVPRKVPSYCRHNNTWRQIYNFYLESECQGYHRVFSKNLMFLKLRTWQMANSYIRSTLCFFFFAFVFPLCQIYNKRNKLPSTQLIRFTPLIWQHVSTSQGHLQVSAIKYLKGTSFTYFYHWPENNPSKSKHVATLKT